jgi:pantoate--beta-alanine ligase
MFDAALESRRAGATPTSLHAFSEPAEHPMALLRTVQDVRAWTAARHRAGQRVGFVPTMGALHDGHLSLIEACRDHADAVLVSIFVNPTQFAPGEDLAAYPRDEVGDLTKAQSAGADAVFLPEVHTMYRPGATTTVTVPALQNALCGLSRPHHFTGVCTVVSKLFNITRCDVAVFGEKDYQQLAVIRRMVLDLDLPVEVVGAPIVREADGLAMSSRNVRLSPAHRQAARVLSASLTWARAAFAQGERAAASLQAEMRQRIEATPGAVVDYVSVVDAASLQALEGPIEQPAVVALAVHFGATRLIDNTVLTP